MVNTGPPGSRQCQGQARAMVAPDGQDRVGAVKDRRAGTGPVPPGASLGQHGIMDHLPDALLPPHPELAVHPLPGRPVVGRHPPGRADGQHKVDAERRGGRSAGLGSRVDWARCPGHRTAIARLAPAVGPGPWWDIPIVDCRDCVRPSGYQGQNLWGPSASIARWQSTGSGSIVLVPLRYPPRAIPNFTVNHSSSAPISNLGYNPQYLLEVLDVVRGRAV